MGESERADEEEILVDGLGAFPGRTGGRSVPQPAVSEAHVPPTQGTDTDRTAEQGGRTAPLRCWCSVESKADLRVGIGLSYIKIKLFFWRTHFCGLGLHPRIAVVKTFVITIPSSWGPSHLCSGAQTAITDIPSLSCYKTPAPSIHPGPECPFCPLKVGECIHSFLHFILSF